ncbi:hypothetical protein [Leclercia sp. AS011]|uniref:hypothetical protein n=1 Tax=Leclercia sp. AS011 TaxID=3081257 RepID=UPI00301B1E10
MIVKRPDMFGFRNPGLMRLPQQVATPDVFANWFGGESRFRNAEDFQRLEIG